MKKERDILNSPELKENPFTLPNGYASELKGRLRDISATKTVSIRQKMTPVISFAAAIALLVTAGTFILEKVTPAEDEYLENLLLSEISTIDEYYEFLSLQGNEELTEEDIIDYLIYTDTPLDSIEQADEH